jgi:4-amino-4-deoxy-L-arabinose transferase-like glycosyltransferase
MPFGFGVDAPAAALGRTVSRSRAARSLVALLHGPSASFGAVVAGLALLTALRFVLGATLPLSFDEAYYWLWSKHLAASYFDHPPAIAYAIRAGTALFGDTVIGVRMVPLLGSILASWAVWRSARILLGSGRDAALACLYFNLTLMVAAESMAATPDSPALAAAAVLLFALAKLQASGDGRWWLAIGAAGGLCILSKYTGFFLGAGIAFWLVAAPQGRVWLKTVWPYAGGLIALTLFSPVIAWNAAHHWISFEFQFGRVATGGLTLRYFGEFLAAQAALASPFLFCLGATGFVRAARVWRAGPPVALTAALIWPAAIYFLIHATHDRVQGNWPSFIYPAFAILAVYGAREAWRGKIAAPVVAVLRWTAVPIAALILAVVYAQAFFGVVLPHGRDPIARLTAIGFQPVADGVAALAHAQGAHAILTTSYATTSWLAFYLRPRMNVVQINEAYRWLSAPAADPGLFRQPLLFVTQKPQKSLPDIAAQFSHIRHLAHFDRTRNGTLIDSFDVYSVSGSRGAVAGREP